jgi:hypothetical protein
MLAVARLVARVMAARRPGLALTVALVAVAGCSAGSDVTHQISVFAVQPGQCFTAPSAVKVQLSTLEKTSCSKPHTQEAYAIVAYEPAAGATASATGVAFTAPYPGDDVLAKFAQGVCAQRYGPYVGVDYLDSKLFFTYLLPSARSWQQEDDRNVICFVTTTGSTLTSSVKGSKQ